MATQLFVVKQLFGLLHDKKMRFGDATFIVKQLFGQLHDKMKDLVTQLLS